MKSLSDIVAAARLNEALDAAEARYAIVAFDVLLYKLDLPADPVRLQEYFTAAESDPQTYIGEANSPDNPDAVAWYKAMGGIPDAPALPSCYSRRLDCEACFGACPVRDVCYGHTS